MASVLQKYTDMKSRLSNQITAGQLPPEQMLQYQELLYRIDVLESLMAFGKTAPVTMDQRILIYHYQMLDAFIICLLQERRFGQPGDEKVKQQRECAYGNLNSVVTNCRKQFSSFNPVAQDTYRGAVQNMINTILPAWVSYRNTYVAMNLGGKNELYREIFGIYKGPEKVLSTHISPVQKCAGGVLCIHSAGCRSFHHPTGGA